MNTTFVKQFLIGLCILGLTGIYSCSEDDDTAPPEPPNLNFQSGSANEERQPGNVLDVTISLSASEGLKSLQVDLDGTAIETVDYTSGNINTYNLVHEVPVATPFGTVFEFDFTLTDQLDQTDELRLTLTVTENTYAFTEEEIGGEQVLVLKGTIFDQLTLDAGTKYMLDTIVSVDDGGELVIPAGTTIYGRFYESDQQNSRLDILRGGRITAEGTKDNPIVFTSEKDLTGEAQPGDWGGIGIYGRAPTNVSADGTHSSEDLGRTWGGQVNDDNSGILKYVRIEYAGKNSAVNSLNLYGVGTGTTLEYIQIWRSADEGFKMNGGLANLRYVVATDLYDDELEAEDGWRGFMQFYLIEQNRDREGGTSLSIKNNSGADPVSRPTISNVTYIGPSQNFTEDPTDFGNEGIDVEDGASGRFFNVLATECPDDAVRIRDAPEAITGIGGDLVVAHSIVWNNKDDFEDDGLIFIDTPEYNNSTEDPGIGVGLNSFVGVVTENAFDPTTLDPWFLPATYIGAVPADNDWTADGEWCKNRDGSIR